MDLKVVCYSCDRNSVRVFKSKDEEMDNAGWIKTNKGWLCTSCQVSAKVL